MPAELELEQPVEQDVETVVGVLVVVAGLKWERRGALGILEL